MSCIRVYASFAWSYVTTRLVYCLWFVYSDVHVVFGDEGAVPEPRLGRHAARVERAVPGGERELRLGRSLR
jgi:hypothetical protein